MYACTHIHVCMHTCTQRTHNPTTTPHIYMYACIRRRYMLVQHRTYYHTTTPHRTYYRTTTLHRHETWLYLSATPHLLPHHTTPDQLPCITYLCITWYGYSSVCCYNTHETWLLYRHETWLLYRHETWDMTPCCLLLQYTWDMTPI
jgi:hypothetical protein